MPGKSDPAATPANMVINIQRVKYLSKKESFFTASDISDP